jgi:hypothetical protein
MDAQTFWRNYSLYYPELLATTRRVPRAHMLNTARYSCGKKTCDMTRDGLLLYRAHDHLSMNGSRFLAQQLLHDYPVFAAAVTHNRTKLVSRSR